MPTPKLTINDAGVYIATWSENRRSKRKSMGTKDRAAAEKRFAQWLLLGGHKGEVGEEGDKSLTVGELWTVYEARHAVNVAAPETIKYCWKNLKCHFDVVHLSDIDQTMIDRYVEKRQAGLIGKPSVSGTIRRELNILKAMLNWHTMPERGKNRLISVADIPSFKLPEDSPPRERWLTEQEIEKLFRALNERQEYRMSRVGRFLWLALETAAREQAIFDLTWDRVDFETRVINYAVPGQRQTKKRRVAVPISDRLLQVLMRMHEERISKYVLDTPQKGSNWRAVQAIVRSAGLAEKDPHQPNKATGISPHTFRHTAATHMLRRGVPIAIVAQVLGNTVAMVERVYGHHCRDRMRDAVNMISGEGVTP